MKYRIIRMFKNQDRVVRSYTVCTGITLTEAQEHCLCPETSSSTCTMPAGVKRTERYGPWFDGYEVMR